MSDGAKAFRMTGPFETHVGASPIWTEEAFDTTS